MHIHQHEVGCAQERGQKSLLEHERLERQREESEGELDVAMESHHEEVGP